MLASLSFVEVVLALLVVGHIYVVVKGVHVRRPFPFMWFGITGLIMGVVVTLFRVGARPENWQIVVTQVLQVLFATMSLKGFLLSLYKGRVPVWDTLWPPVEPEVTQQSAPAEPTGETESGS